MMAEKILALLVAFFGGAALTALGFTKLVNLGLRHSPALRKLLRDALDQHDMRHAMGRAPHLPADDGVPGYAAYAAFHDAIGSCEVCFDPIDKPYIDEGGAKLWRRCPNRAERAVEHGGHKLRVCEEHFQALQESR